MTLYNETHHLYQQCRKDDTICQLLIHCAIFLSLLVKNNVHPVQICLEDKLTNPHLGSLISVENFLYSIPSSNDVSIFHINRSSNPTMKMAPLTPRAKVVASGGPGGQTVIEDQISYLDISSYTKINIHL